MRMRLLGCAAMVWVACGSRVQGEVDRSPVAEPVTRPDAGSPDGGSLACADLKAANAGTGNPCGVLRPVLGHPIAVQDNGEVFCSRIVYPASGTGVVPFDRFVQVFGTGLSEELVFLDRDGTKRGLYSPEGPNLTGFAVVPLSSGFGVITGYQTSAGPDQLYSVDFFDDDARRFASSAPLAEDAAPFAGGGLLTSGFVGEQSGASTGCPSGFGAVTLETYDAKGQRTGHIDHELGCYRGPPGPDRVVATNWQGNTLVLLQNGTWTVSWLYGPELRAPAPNVPLPDFPATYTTRVRAAPLVDGSVALALDGVWRFRLAPGASTLEPVPCWLSDRPGTDVRIISDELGYALLTPTTRCDQALEIVTREGLSCGELDLGPPATGCGDAFFTGIAIGRDGTIARAPIEVDAGTGQNAVCTFEFWPAALGRSGP